MSSPNAIKCSFCRVRTSGLFRDLEPDLVHELDRATTMQEFKPGQVLFYEGSPPLAVYCVHNGLIKLYKMGSRGEPQVVALLGPGDSVGYQAVVADEPLTVTAEAMAQASICVIRRETFDRLLERSATLGSELMARLASDLRASQERTLALTQLSAKRRAAQLLLFLHHNLHRDRQTSSPLGISLPRKEMAQMIGVTPETLSRVLRGFAEHDLIEHSRTVIRLKNETGLQMIADKSRT